MRYHFEKPKLYGKHFGEVYICDHQVYDSCTLYKIGTKGLAVIQQRFDPDTKTSKWAEIDEDLMDVIFIHKNFKRIFDQKAGEAKDGVYPTVTVRQLMYAMRMKPLPREKWETYFDRPYI